MNTNEKSSVTSLTSTLFYQYYTCMMMSLFIDLVVLLYKMFLQRFTIIMLSNEADYVSHKAH